MCIFARQRGVHKTVKDKLWPWFEPFSVQKKRCDLAGTARLTRLDLLREAPLQVGHLLGPLLVERPYLASDIGVLRYYSGNRGLLNAIYSRAGTRLSLSWTAVRLCDLLCRQLSIQGVVSGQARLDLLREAPLQVGHLLGPLLVQRPHLPRSFGVYD